MLARPSCSVMQFSACKKILGQLICSLGMTAELVFDGAFSYPRLRIRHLHLLPPQQQPPIAKDELSWRHYFYLGNGTQSVTSGRIAFPCTTIFRLGAFVVVAVGFLSKKLKGVNENPI